MRLKELREQRGISQTELANFLGVVRSTICQYEKGNRMPDSNILGKLADYFGVTVDYLLGREDDSERDEKPQLHIPDKYKDVLVAFEGGPDDLTQDDIDDVVKYIEFVRARKKKD